MAEQIYAVSKCLLGFPCRYDNEAAPNQAVIEFLEGKKIVPICPEQLGGLPTPRTPSEIVGGAGKDVLDGGAKVVARTGEDRTDAFVSGARTAAEIAVANGATDAILKSKSPSCGVHRIYDGSFTGAKRQGGGVTAALLQRMGLNVVSDEEIANARAAIGSEKSACHQCPSATLGGGQPQAIDSPE